jgi:methylglutaconyl-CoA hydratase
MSRNPTMPNLLVTRTRAQVATVTLNRPELHNAFDDTLIGELTAQLHALGEDADVRVVVLTGAGKSFSAGADLHWMRRIADYSEEENYHDAMALAELMSTLNNLQTPTIARVNGSAFGGGVGLIACCDIAVMVDSAQLAFSEARLGLIPAVISPYVVAAIGERMARRYFLTAEPFDAAQAKRMQLVHEVVTEAALDASVNAICETLLGCGGEAQQEAKDLITSVAHRPVTGSVIADTAERIARMRASAEGQEGIRAFLEKRIPAWKPKQS